MSDKPDHEAARAFAARLAASDDLTSFANLGRAYLSLADLLAASVKEYAKIEETLAEWTQWVEKWEPLIRKAIEETKDGK